MVVTIGWHTYIYEKKPAINETIQNAFCPWEAVR